MQLSRTKNMAALVFIHDDKFQLPQLRLKNVAMC